MTFEEAEKRFRFCDSYQTMARRFFPNSSPIGRRFGIGETPHHPADIEVIGVVKDARYFTLNEGPMMEAYFSVHSESRVFLEFRGSLCSQRQPAGDHLPGPASHCRN